MLELLQRLWQWAGSLPVFAQVVLGLLLLVALLALFARLEQLAADVARWWRGPRAPTDEAGLAGPLTSALLGLLGLGIWGYAVFELGERAWRLPGAYRAALIVWLPIALLLLGAGLRRLLRLRVRARRLAAAGRYPLLAGIRRVWRKGQVGRCVICKAARLNTHASRIATVRVSEDPATDQHYALCYGCTQLPQPQLLQRLQEIELTVDWAPQPPPRRPPEELY